jgi:hypothetical protein
VSRQGWFLCVCVCMVLGFKLRSLWRTDFYKLLSLFCLFWFLISFRICF